MEGGRGACRVELTEAAHRLGGGQRLHGHAALLQLEDRVGIGPHAAVGAGPHDQVRGKLLKDLDEIVKTFTRADFAQAITFVNEVAGGPRRPATTPTSTSAGTRSPWPCPATPKEA